MNYRALHFSDSKADRHAESAEEHLDQPGRENIRAFYEYWHSKRRGNQIPLRTEIDPLDIPKLLRNIFLVDIFDGPPVDYRYRLVGTEIVELDGECTGMYLSEMLPDRKRFSNLWQQYDDIRKGHYWLRVEDLPHREKGHLIRYEVLLLPLADPLGRITMIFGYAHQRPE